MAIAKNDIAFLEEELAKLLESGDVKTKLRAAELTLKLVALKHRIEHGNKDESFFD